MPLHPVGLIVGGAIAVIGSGYAFKKLIYDPHLAPFIQDLIDSNPFFHEHLPNQRNAIPVPAYTSSTARGVHPSSSYATSTARQPNFTKLRRRSNRSSQGEMEMRESLLHAHHAAINEEREYYLEGNGLNARVRSRMVDPPVGSKRVADGISSSPTIRKRRLSDAPPLIIQDNDYHNDKPLIDLNDHHDLRVTSPQDAEVRSVIFNYESRPVSGRNTPAPAPAMPPVLTAFGYFPGIPTPQPQKEIEDYNLAESTTFSFLSLSQTSSPQMGNSMLGSWSFGKAGESNSSPNTNSEGRIISPVARNTNLRTPRSILKDIPDIDSPKSLFSVLSPPTSPIRSTGKKVNEEDVISISDGVSDYVDAESYTPRTNGGLSPAFPAFPNVPTSPPRSSLGLSERDENEVEHLGLSFVRSPAGLRRGPMSVVSLSDSEGASEWEAV